jgi:hypothetical protein
MKSLFYFFVCFLFSTIGKAQSIEDNDNILSISVGLGSFYKSSDSFNKESPTLGLMYERALPLEWERAVIGIGCYAGARSLVSKNSSGFLYYDKHYTFIIGGLRSSFHYNEWFRSYDLDSYAGIMYSYCIFSLPDKSDYVTGADIPKKKSGTGPSIYAGLRYYLDKSWAVYGEVGFGLSYLTLGACAKF